MSKENVEIVRRIFEKWATGDFQASVPFLDEHVMWVASPDLPEFGVFVGPRGVAEFMHRFLGQWEHLTLEAEQVETSGDTVLVSCIQHAKGRVSGIEGDSRYFILFSFRGEKIIRMETLLREGEARRAAGLSE